MLKLLDSGFRRNDGKARFLAFYEFVKFEATLQLLKKLLQGIQEEMSRD